MMKLSQRMIRTFCANITTSNKQSWTALSESSSNDSTRVTVRNNTEPGQPKGVMLTAVSIVWLPFSHSRVFELLADEQKRTQLLDALLFGNALDEVACIANGFHQKNCLSLMSINSGSKVEVVLQENITHELGGSIVVNATIDVDVVQSAMNGGDISCIPLLPTGFVAIPTPSPNNPSGRMLTVGMQVLETSILSAKLSLSSVTSINTRLSSAVRQITNALGNNHCSV